MLTSFGLLRLAHFTDMSAHEVQALTHQLTAFDTLILKFGRGLPSIHSARSGDEGRRLILLHTIANVSSIRLHHAFIGRNPQSLGRVGFSTVALGQIVQNLDREHSPFADPLLGVSEPSNC
jgi:hypothetical protein